MSIGNRHEMQWNRYSVVVKKLQSRLSGLPPRRAVLQKWHAAIFTCGFQKSRGGGLHLEIAGRRAPKNAICRSLTVEAGARGTAGGGRAPPSYPPPKSCFARKWYLQFYTRFQRTALVQEGGTWKRHSPRKVIANMRFAIFSLNHCTMNYSYPYLHYLYYLY